MGDGYESGIVAGIGVGRRRMLARRIGRAGNAFNGAPRDSGAVGPLLTDLVTAFTQAARFPFSPRPSPRHLNSNPLALSSYNMRAGGVTVKHGVALI
jgi:hypothetical protein